MSQLYTIRRAHPDDILGEISKSPSRTRQRAAAKRKRHARLKEFMAEIRGAKSVTVSDNHCTCGRNHYQVIVKNGEDRYYCPILFWLNTCQLVQERDGIGAMRAWATEHPVSKHLKRIDASKDANFWRPS